MTLDEKRHAVLAAGVRLGFLSPRVARVTKLERADFYERWLADGRAGDMRFLLHHRKARLDPRTRYPWVRSIVSAFFPYSPPPPPSVDWASEMRGRIAAYALGRDYHDVMRARLDEWADAIRSVLPGAAVKSFVDTGAVFEHEWAARAGVGWTGKHTLTLSEASGSYAFLGELLLDVELPPDAPVPDRCGQCTRCLDACPTGAIEDGYRLEPRRCISYLTIEHRGAIAPELRPMLGAWIFGCDLCQLACPWNRDAASEPSAELAPELAPLLQLDEAGFARRYGESAVRRTGRIGLARNATIALGNTANPLAARPLMHALAQHDSALVRAHAAWALGRLVSATGRDARRALDDALRDPDQDVRAEARAAIEAA